MSLSDLLSDFIQHLHSPEFHQLARHPKHPGAFTRQRKLPLPSLVAVMLCGMSKSVQAELDSFFAHLHQQSQLLRQVSEQAFAQARAKLSHHAIPALNAYLIDRAEASGWLARWQGLRLVAADASKLRFGLRASHTPRAASADQIAFGLYLPGSELMLAASLHSVHENERQMLFEHLDRLGPQDLLLLDRGYPCRWLAALLNQRGIAFCMRVDMGADSGFGCVQRFRRSGLPEQIVTLPKPDRRDVVDYECPATAPRVRLVRQVSPSGQVRVLMTNLFDTRRFPAEAFGDLYHQRWRIEVAFGRLKHRLNLEHVSGLSHQTVRQDFAAKILCDNLEALITLAAQSEHPIAPDRRINRAYAHTVLKPLLPALLLGHSLVHLLRQAMALIVRRTFKHRPGLSKPRKTRPKSHKHMALKPC